MDVFLDSRRPLPVALDHPRRDPLRTLPSLPNLLRPLTLLPQSAGVPGGRRGGLQSVRTLRAP
jgi:hypothetical protein